MALAKLLKQKCENPLKKKKWINIVIGISKECLGPRVWWPVFLSLAVHYNFETGRVFGCDFVCYLGRAKHA